MIRDGTGVPIFLAAGPAARLSLPKSAPNKDIFTATDPAALQGDFGIRIDRVSAFVLID